MKKITIITGHYGSGKTNLAVNLAMQAHREGRSVAVADLDIVNPYFRTADFKELFEENNINLIAPDFANSNLDIPSIQFDLEQIAKSEDCLIIDVGGDDAGAVALGRYAEALSYAEAALELNDEVEDRSYMMEEYAWYLLPTSPNNYIYISSSGESWWVPFADNLSLETVAKFEDGDFVIDYGYSGYPEEGEELWNPMYGEMNTGIEGSLSFTGYDTYKNPWGITVEQMMYVAAECHIRSGAAGGVQKGMEMINHVRTFRIDPDKYTPWSASTEQEAMAYLQQAKFIENIATAENFFDRKRWNTEEDYKMTVTREIPGVGTYSIAPESPLWVLPFPNSVIQNNPTFTQNY